MPELGNQQLLHCQPHRARGARQRHDDAARHEAGAGSGHHRRRADLLIAEHPEKFAETVEPFFEERADRLVRVVAGSDSRPAVRDDHLHPGIGKMPFDRAVDQLGIVPDDRTAGDDMAAGRQQLGNQAAARIVLQRSRIADRDDEAMDRLRGVGLVLDDAHDEDCSGRTVLRDKLLARMREMGDHPDHQRLAAEVLGIRGAPEALARRLVSQALVVGDRKESWRQIGDRICREAPAAPGVYVLRDDEGRALYVGKAINVRRRLRAHFAERRWRATNPGLARAAAAEWRVVGSELEALLREADLIQELQPAVNVQIGSPDLEAREIPRALLRDVVVLAPSVEEDSVELIGARVDGGWIIQRTRRNGADLAVHATRLMKFFAGRDLRNRCSSVPLGPIVFSWLAGRGAGATRLDPHAAASARAFRLQLSGLLGDERLFTERLVIYS